MRVRSTRALLIVTAVIELGTGVALVFVPSMASELLLGEGLVSSSALVVARVAGVALISISVACWRARNSERREQFATGAGILTYNVSVPVVLLHGWLASSLAGLGLWPAILLHTALAIWCVACLRSVR